MKTTEQIQHDIKVLSIQLEQEDRDSKINKLTKEIQQLRQYQKYLDVPCEESHLARQLEKLRGDVFKIVDGFKVWKQANPDIVEKYGTESQLKAIYNNKMGLRKIKSQIKAVEYLLN